MARVDRRRRSHVETREWYPPSLKGGSSNNSSWPMVTEEMFGGNTELTNVNGPGKVSVTQMNRSDRDRRGSVPCPSCGVASEERCLLHSGTPRSEPHVDRKLSAAEAIVTKRIPRGPGRR